MKNNFILIFTIIILSACAGAPPKSEDSEGPAAAPPIERRQEAPVPKPGAPVVLDIEDIERKLNLPSQFDELGIHEKRFNPCLLGYKTPACDPQIFTMINFQVVCRDSEGTVESSDYELSPFAQKTLQLKVGPNKAETHTDAEGYSQIRFIGKKSAKDLMFVLSSPPHSLGLRANGVRKVIVPSDWCR